MNRVAHRAALDVHSISHSAHHVDFARAACYAADKSNTASIRRIRSPIMSSGPTRRDFLAQLGVTAAATGIGASVAGVGVAGIAHAQDKPKGSIPDKPFR